MDALNYPFDSGFILKKRKSIKRELLSDGTKRITKRIAVLGGSTTSGIFSGHSLYTHIIEKYHRKAERRNERSGYRKQARKSVQAF